MHKITSWFDHLPLKRKGGDGARSFVVDRHATAPKNSRSDGGTALNKATNAKKKKDGGGGGLPWHRKTPPEHRVMDISAPTLVGHSATPYGGLTTAMWTAADYREDRLAVTTADHQHQYYGRMARSVGVAAGRGLGEGVVDVEDNLIMTTSTPTASAVVVYSCYAQEENEDRRQRRRRPIAPPGTPSPVDSCGGGSTGGRAKIRTNPWFTPARSFRDVCLRAPPVKLDTRYASVDRRCREGVSQTRALGADVCTSAPKPSASLEDSLCSSGYGSLHDSSPESSVHTPEWHPALGGSVFAHKPPRLCAQVTTQVELTAEEDEAEEEDECSVYDDCLELSSDEEAEDCAACRTQGGQTSVRRAPPRLEIPPPPPLQPRSAVLCELNDRLAELRQTSLRLTAATWRAHEQRERRMKERQLMLEQVDSLRKLKWNVRRNFELAL